MWTLPFQGFSQEELKDWDIEKRGAWEGQKAGRSPAWSWTRRSRIWGWDRGTCIRLQKDCYPPHHVYLPQPGWHQIVTDETTAASFCYYCDICPGGKAAVEFKPDYVVPFQIDKKRLQIFTQWVGRKNLYLIISFLPVRSRAWPVSCFPYWL